jgi:hypothetical protein
VGALLTRRKVTQQPQQNPQLWEGGPVRKPCAAFVPLPSGAIVLGDGLHDALALPTGAGQFDSVGTLGHSVATVGYTTDSVRLNAAANQFNTIWEKPSAQVSLLVYFTRRGNSAGNTPIFGNQCPNDFPYSAWHLIDKSNGYLQFEIGYSPTLNPAVVTSSVPIPNGVPVVVLCTYDGATMRLFQNGVLVGATSQTGAIFYPNVSDRGPSVGGFYNFTGAARGFQGQIFGGALWDVALSDAEIASLTSEPNLIFKPKSRRMFAGIAAGGNSASLAWLEPNDSTVISGSATVTATAAWTESSDVFAVTAQVKVTGTAAWTEAGDTTAIAAAATASGSLGWTESADSTAITAQAKVTASASWIEPSDITVISGSAGATASASWAEPSDAVSIAATATVNAAASWTETSDTASLSGSVGNAIAINAAWTEQSDAVAISASASIAVTAAWTEASDTTALSGPVGNAVAANINWTEADTFAASATLSITASAGWAEQSDLSGFNAQVLATAGLSWSEPSDTTVISAAILATPSASIAWTEASDTHTIRGLSAAQLTINPHRIYVGLSRTRAYTAAPRIRTI